MADSRLITWVSLSEGRSALWIINVTKVRPPGPQVVFTWHAVKPESSPTDSNFWIHSVITLFFFQLSLYSILMGFCSEPRHGCPVPVLCFPFFLCCFFQCAPFHTLSPICAWPGSLEASATVSREGGFMRGICCLLTGWADCLLPGLLLNAFHQILMEEWIKKLLDLGLGSN